jgi:hypothetical protein
MSIECIWMFCGKCASYIIQLFNSENDFANIELRLSAPCVIANHVGCCCKHAGFEVPEAASANVASIDSEKKGMRSYQQAVSITSLSGLPAEMQDSHLIAVRYLSKRASAKNVKLPDA